jgi:PAS domain S-box-containing protein
MHSSHQNPHPKPSPLAIRSSILSVAGGYAIFGGIVTLTGWFADLPRLTDWDDTGISMMPNAALCAFLTGAALLLVGRGFRRLVITLGALVGLIGAATLFEHATGINLGIDQLLIKRDWGQRGTLAPGRMGPPGSTSWTVIGACLVMSMLGGKLRRAAAWFAVVPIAIAMLSLLGFLYGAAALYTIPQLTTIALQTSTMIFGIGIALIASVPEYGFAAWLRRDDPGGEAARRLLLPIIVFPMALGGLRLAGQHAGLYDVAFGTAARTIIEIALLIALLWWTAQGLSRSSRAAAERARLLDLTADAIFIRDPSNQIVYWNRGATEAYGYTSEEAIGKSPYELLNTVFPEPLDEIERKLRETGYWQGLLIHHRKDGSQLTDLSRWTIQFPSSGEQASVLESNTDITDRRRAEEALRDADRRKDEFLATLAHELRNPLAPVCNSVEILRANAPDSPKLRWALDVIDRQLQQLTRLIDDLLDISRISRDRLELRLENVELAAIVEAAVETSRPLVDAGGHDLQVTLPDQPIFLRADATRLAQVISNLLNNACKYTESGGQIVLAAQRLGSDVQIEVKDNGIGIPPDRLPNIFDMFSQVQDSLSRSQGGLGIGLSLVKRLVEMHGGHVEARSDGLGQGSEFRIRMPIIVAPSDDIAAAKQRVRSSLKSQLRILVVDDNRDAAKTQAILLRTMGNDVITAHDGQEACQQATNFRPDVVLLDIGLPKMNGYEVARYIRQQSWGPSIVLIAVTGWGQDDDRARTEQAGFDHHLVKPVEPASLMKFLADLQLAKA